MKKHTPHGAPPPVHQPSPKHSPSLLQTTQIAASPLRGCPARARTRTASGGLPWRPSRLKPARHRCQRGVRMSDSLLAAVRHSQNAEVLLSLLESAHVRQELNK